MAAKVEEIDRDQMTNVKAHVDQMKTDNKGRNEMFDSFEAMYMMKWSEATNQKLANAKVIISPDARNSLVGAVRLMIATDPSFTVPLETSDAETKAKSERIEQAATRMWDQAGRIAGNPIHYDAILSSMLYGEMHTAITSTRRLLALHKRSGKDVARFEYVAAMTPFLLENWSPRHGYAESDNVSLTAYYREAKTTPQKLVAEWGKEALPEKLLTGNVYRSINLHVYWDTQWEAVWCDEGDLRCTEHELPCLPVSVQMTDGSMLFDKPEDQRQPLLYTMLYSRMWNAQNIALTVLFTTVFGMGVSPVFLHKSPGNAADKKLVLNFDNAISVVELEGDEKFEPVLNRGLIDPALVSAMNLAERKVTESTLYHQALGEPIDRRTSFSEANLMAQSGRLPLVGTQKRGGWGIARIIETAFQLFRKNETKYKGKGIEIKPSDIPSNLQVDVKLEINLPQDRLQLANTINVLTGGASPRVSLRWALENILGVGQADKMQGEIWTELASNEMFQEYVLKQRAEAQAQATAMIAAAQQGAPGGPGVPPAPGEGGGPNATPFPSGNEPQPGVAPGQGQMQGMPSSAPGAPPVAPPGVPGGQQVADQATQAAIRRSMGLGG